MEPPIETLLEHPFFKTQMVYDHAPEAATIPSYTRSLWDRQHRRMSRDFARFKPKEKVRVLDIGCGPAHIADSQAAHIETYVGVDPSLLELRRARKAVGRFFVRGAAEEIDFPANSFDMVIMVSVLDHCIDWRHALHRAVQSLRPGGVMLIVMENAEQLPSRVRRWLGRKVEHLDHMHFISVDDVKAALGDQLVALQVDTFGYGFGLQAVSSRFHLPRFIFDLLHPVLDGIGKLLMPRSGQVLYGWYQKVPDPTATISEAVFRSEPEIVSGVIDALGHHNTSA